MYQDYAISPELFHWQSQSTTRADSETGRRYRLGGSRVLLFVRDAAKETGGLTKPYLCLGPAEYVSHEGERPMSIVWRLRYGLPVAFFRVVRIGP